MKKLTLVACAAGLVAGGLATVAQAGQIQASSTNYAREAVISDTTKVALPVISYKLLGSVGSTTQPTNFSMTVDIDNGDYDTTTGNVTTAGMVYIRDQNLAATVAVPFTANTVTVVGKKMTVTFVIPANALNVYPNPIVIFNQFPVAAATANTAYNAPVPVTGDGKVVTLFSGAGLAMLDCTISTKFVNAVVKHFNAAGVEDDSTRSGNTNTAVVLGFPTTHAAVVTANGTAGTLDVLNSNKSFAAGAGGTMQFTAGAGAISTTQVLLGRVDLVGAATGYGANVPPVKPAGLLGGLDANGAAAYTTGAVTATPAGTAYASILGTTAPHAAAATLINGPVEIAGFKVDVTADQGMVVGGTLFLSPASNCAGVFGGATTTITAATGAAGVVNSLTSALGTTNTTSVYVCYTVPNTLLVPSSGFRAVATVLKSSGALGEQNNISCAAPLASLGGSLKIDVRNYVPAARSAVAGGWTSVLRLINNSEVNSVKVFAQTIDSAGLFGRSALINTLAPRAAVYMLNSQIDGLLAGATTGSAATNAISTNLVGNATDFNNTRLRITAEGSDTLRVQNYLVGPQGQFVEASGAQGVDLANGQVANRAGDSGSLLDQDAQKGLNGQ